MLSVDGGLSTPVTSGLSHVALGVTQRFPMPGHLEYGAHPPARGSGPRIFCGHVPKDVDEVAVKNHFSQWGMVTDVYFPRHKKTLKRRPFCFVTFSSPDAVQRALAESPLSIGGHPIKSLTAVEERDAYYREKHAAGLYSQQQRAAGLAPMLGGNSAGAIPPALAAALLQSPQSLLEFQRLVQLLSPPPPTMALPAPGFAHGLEATLPQGHGLMGAPQPGVQAMGGPSLQQQQLWGLLSPADPGSSQLAVGGAPFAQDPSLASLAGLVGTSPSSWESLLPHQLPAAAPWEMLRAQQQQQLYTGALAQGRPQHASLDLSLAGLSIDPEGAAGPSVMAPRISDSSLVSRSGSNDSQSESLLQRSTGLGSSGSLPHASWPSAEAERFLVAQPPPELERSPRSSPSK